MDSSTTKVDPQKPKNLIRSQYKDVMVKVDEDIYYLDRFWLALKSGYFEKLFTNDFSDKNCDSIELPIMDTDTFHAVVDIIYGEELVSVLNAHNYVSLLIAMDYLQMEVDLDVFESFIRKIGDNKRPYKLPLNTSIPRLCRYITLMNSNFQNLLLTVYDCVSKNLTNIREQDLDEFLSLSFDHFIQIILSRSSSVTIDQRACSKICAKWICHDLENRLPHLIDLVNAAKVRFKLPNEIHPDDSSVRLPVIDEHTHQDTLSRYFYKLLMYAGVKTATNSLSEIQVKYEATMTNHYRRMTAKAEVKYRPDYNSEKSEDEAESEYEPEPEPKLETFLRNGNFYDIILKAGTKSYKLHRPILKSASGYFEEIFFVEYSEAIAKCEGLPTLPSKDKEYFLDGIDQIIFDIIVDFIYLKKLKITSDIVFRLFQAADILKIDSLLAQCKKWLKKEDNSKNVGTEDVIKILNFAHEHSHHKDLNQPYLSKYINDCWPEMDYLPQFAELFKVIVEPEETTEPCNESKVSLLNIIDRETFEWIVNRVHHFDTATDIHYSNIVQVLKASQFFKMKDLMEDCMEWLNDTHWCYRPIEKIDLGGILRFVGTNIECENINKIYTVVYLTQWPDIDNSLLGSISRDLLEDVLMSPNFYLDDPHKILDMCSKWITHDVENRFCLIPEIALAISRNRFVNCEDHSVNKPSDLSNCTEDFVREKLWQILSSTSVLPSEELSSNKKKKLKTEQPVFLTCMNDGTLDIYDADGDKIESLRISVSFKRWDYLDDRKCCISATKINNNLFILYVYDKKSYFEAYNFSSKKLLFLTADFPLLSYGYPSEKKFTLLNCRKEIYCCIIDGTVLKYSFELNRWATVSKSVPNTIQTCFTSDGNILYRIRTIKVEGYDYSGKSHILETYDFEQNLWKSLPDASTLRIPHSFVESPDRNCSYYGYGVYDDYSIKDPELSNLIVVKNNLAVLCDEKIILFNQRSRKWKFIDSLPFESSRSRRGSYSSREDYFVIAKDQTGGILYVFNKKLYHMSLRDQRWESRKKLPDERKWKQFERGPPYKSIIVIHNV